MSISVDFLAARVMELEKKVNYIIDKLNGVVSEAAVKQLSTLRQAEMLEMKQDLENLKLIVMNQLNQP